MPGGPLPRLGGIGAFDDLGDELGALPDTPTGAGSGSADRVGDAGATAGPAVAEAGGHRRRWRIDVTPEELVSDLNGPQRRAVEHRGGPLLVVAGAGSGKTRVLTRRVAHLIATGDALPWEILAITFTNKAADEMRERLARLVGPIAERMWISTFHAACVRILRAHAERLGYRRTFTIYDDTDARRLLEQVLRDLGVDTKKLPARSVQAAVSRAKAESKDPVVVRDEAQGVFERRIADAYAEYQQRLQAASAMDFDDLLTLTVQLLRSCPDVLDDYRHRFRHVLVDEYQDTNHVQNELVLLLAAEHRNVCVVGDSDQSIYSFRAADIRNILEFEDAFPDAVVIPLEQNYRSTRTILEAANAVIARNASRVPKELWTEGAAGEPIRRYRAEDEHDEATWVAAEIDRLCRSEGLRYGDVAVFFRTNAQSRAFEEALVRTTIPYRVVGGTRFYDRREVKDLLAYLKVLVNPDDEMAARRIVNVPRRGVGDTSVERLAAWARAQRTSFAEALGHATEAGLAGTALRGVTALQVLLDDLRRLAASGANPGEIVETVAERTGYRAGLEAEDTLEARSRLENIDELAGAGAQYDSIEAFLEAVALVSDADELDSEGSRVSLMTLHTAKGLEFPAVFLVGMEDGIFPHLRALDDPWQLEEERRLCYVGITRAQRLLYVTHAWSRSQWGTTSYAIPSRFLSELPEALVRDVGGSGRARDEAAREGPGVGGGWRGGRRRSPGIDPWEESQLPAGDPPWEEGHDPDPWGEGDTAVHGRAGRLPASSRRVPRAGGAGRAAGASRRGRLPKMAEWRFEQDQQGRHAGRKRPAH